MTTYFTHYGSYRTVVPLISLLCFHFYPLCYTAVLLKFTYSAQYYAQEQEFWSDYYVSYVHYKFAQTI